ncbi:MAG: M56 family metallopeptidase [Gemmatimonadaceae bacterium]
MIDIVVAWLATYALHSTALILLALVVTARRAPWRLATPTRDVIWKSAIVGGLFTASLQVAVGAAPLGGTWKLRPTPTAGTTNVRIVVTADDVRRLTDLPHPLAEMETSATSAFELPPLALGSAARGFPFAFVGSVSAASTYIALAALLWLVGSALMFWRYDRARARLDLMLDDRTAAEDGIAGRVLKEAMRRARVTRSVRLTASDRLESPAVIDSDEICVPRRFLREVSVLEQESILAHELAHVVRRDALWLRIANVVVHAFFFQPLNRIARARLIEAAEFSADEWAVRTTGAPLHLARALAAVASWLSPATRITAFPAMASERGSVLVRRVTQLTSWHHEQPELGRSGGRVFALAIATLVGATLVAPRIDLTNPWSAVGARRMVFEQRIEKGDGRPGTQVRIVDIQLDDSTHARGVRHRFSSSASSD